MEKEQVEELANKWIAALRSGEYQQGQKALKTNDGRYCCLGVLCDIAGLKGIVDMTTLTSFVFRYDGSASTTALPGMFKDEIGMDTECHCDLMSMNDEGRSFEEIADFIEKNRTAIFPKLEKDGDKSPEMV